MHISTCFILISINSITAIPIDTVPDIAAINTYLYGESSPEWLKNINDEGFVEPSLNISMTDPFYDAASSVKFYLYTKKDPRRYQIILENLDSIKYSSFDPKNDNKFLIHGWLDNVRSHMIQEVKDAYMAKTDVNIIVVDWGNGADTLNYYFARHRIGKVAIVVKRFIEFIVKNMGVQTSQIQIIGHSLGAHIAGLVGKKVQIGRIPIIIGLDPALPLFSITKPKSRLNATDANYVEVIHTSAGSLGFDEPIGSADFYPNYGRSQPGCGLDIVGSCAHDRAYEYFAESILTDTGFWSNQCGDYIEIKKKKCLGTGITLPLGGESVVSSQETGNFYLKTNKKRPFAKGI